MSSTFMCVAMRTGLGRCANKVHDVRKVKIRMCVDLCRPGFGDGDDGSIGDDSDGGDGCGVGRIKR